MTVSTPSSNLGRHLFGVAALAFGLITLVWHDYNGWHQPRYIVYAAAVALDLRRRCDSVPSDRENGRSRPVCGFILSSPCCACRRIVAAPRIYNSWGNFFEQFSLVDRSGDRLCALVIGMVTGNASSDRPHSFGHLCRFFYPRTGVLSSPYRPALFRSGFRQVRCFGRWRQLFFSHSRLWLCLRIEWRFSRLAC